MMTMIKLKNIKRVDMQIILFCVDLSTNLLSHLFGLVSHSDFAKILPTCMYEEETYDILKRNGLGLKFFNMKHHHIQQQQDEKV